MAKIYDVYDNFNEEMRNISHFFNLNYNEKKISNEEFIFNFLEQQQAEKKIADCVNILKGQNKVAKKEECPRKDEHTIKASPDVKIDKKVVKGDIEKKSDKVFNTNIEVETKPTKSDVPIQTKPAKVEVTVQKKEEKVLVEKSIIAEEHHKKAVDKEKTVEEDQNKILKFSKEVKNIENKMSSVVDVVRDSLERAAKQLKIKKENTEHLQEKILSTKKETQEPKEKVLTVKKETAESQEKILTFVKNDRELDFERKYLQNGKYVIDGVNTGTSVFGKKIIKVNTVEKNLEERGKDLEGKKHGESDATKNKRFKINCNIEQNLLNGCYWPTQLS